MSSAIYEHEALLKEWKARHEKLDFQGRFIGDGPINWGQWESADRRVLFLLKEAYDDKGIDRDWDLPELVREYGTQLPRTWPKVAQWAEVLHKYKDGESIPFERERDSKAALGRIAVVNVKKSDGSKTSSDQDLAAHIARDSDLLFQQVAILAPDCVVCGSTWHLLSAVAPWSSYEPVFDRTVWRVGDIHYFDMWHPANHFPQFAEFHMLQNVVRGAGGARLWSSRRSPR